ncbi:MAG TPA: CarD family transcriptional regulator [Blastocatellia bacterium]|nr:CarD family transcriptional regulator [Blastocatellia bacterium]
MLLRHKENLTQWEPQTAFCAILLLPYWRSRRKKALTYREGNKVIYPRLGICRVAGIVEQSISGLTVKLYQLKPLDFQESTTVLVPINKAEGVGVRKLIDKADIPKLLRFLGKDIEVASDHRKRNAKNAERMASGEIYEVADSLKTMAKLSKGKTLSPEEQQTMARARHLIIRELSHVTKLTAEEVEELIDNALAGKRSRTKKLAA